jgi:predicted HAD superfamily Cof-like phosphohydrolase
MRDVSRESKVASFHEAMEMKRKVSFDTKKQTAQELIDFIHMRMSLIQEEVLELKEASDHICMRLSNNDTVAISEKAHLLKELADVQYVVSGFADAFDLPIQPAFNRVHDSNMSKLVDGKPVKREDGKVLKGENYKPPYLEDLVE